MSAPLLQTKLYIPPARPDLVPRPRLIERLNTGLWQNGFREGDRKDSRVFARKLTLVSTPAGFGKTTLLSEWVSRCGPRTRVAWLALDEGDNDPARFLAYVVAALQKIQNQQESAAGQEGVARQRVDTIGAGVLSALQSPQPPPLEMLLTALINQISAISDNPATSLTPEPASPFGPHGQRDGQSEKATVQGAPAERTARQNFVLVLDDYHTIAAQPVHDALEFLLDHLPDNLHVVIATRSDPPLRLARLRGRGQMTELRAADLRFTFDEVDGFLNQAMGLELTSDEVATLAHRTEGWIAGLQMSAIAMRSLVSMHNENTESIASFIQAFTGSNRYVLDYLVEEVLDQRPQGTKDFLLQTSILDRLSGPLSDAVTGQRNGQQTLEQLEHVNLFIVPLDSDRCWYRYHQLFADLLRLRLQQTQPDLVPILHRRASAWYAQQGLMGPAIRHAFSASDFELAADLIERAMESVWKRSELATFLSWVEAVPDKIMHARPLLSFFHALALLMSGQPLNLVEARLKDARESDIDSVSNGMAVFRSLMAAYRGDSRQSADLARRALELLPKESVFLRSVVAGILGLAHLYSGDIGAATNALDTAARIGKETGNILNAVLALCHLAELSSLQGQLYEAQARYEQAVELAIDGQGQPLPVAGVALIGLGQLQQQWNDLDRAENYLLKGIELVRKAQEAAAIQGFVALARIRQARGNPAAALETIQKAWRIALRFDAMEMDDGYVALQQARLWIAQGDIDAALDWVRQRELDRDVGAVELVGQNGGVSWSSLLCVLEQNTLARLYLAQGHPDQALAVLESLLQAAETGGRVPRATVMEMQLLRALALQAQRDIAQALAALECALSLAEPGGFVRIFVDEGKPMAQLLYEAGARGIAPEYVQRLLSAYEVEVKDPDERPEVKAGGSSLAPRPLSLVEALSERELDVLQLIAEGLSNQEVAQRLYLSLHTVKWHTGNIYGKLGVKNRTQAVAQARALGVLPAV
jgi:LuxR family maltose regulon positive regulatory protein